MTQQSELLLVDADPRSMRVLEVSLRAEGFDVLTAVDAAEALTKCETRAPDLILTETRLGEVDGFELVKQLKAKSELATVPIVFLSNQKSIDDKIKGLQLGVEDYLTKPIFVRELITRINMLLARRTHDRIAQEGPPSSRTRFSGSLEDMGVVDLLQTVDVSRKTGVAKIKSGKYQATLSFREGQVVNAELGRLTAEEAVYRLLTWQAGSFEVEFKAVTEADSIDKPLQTLLMEGMRRIDEWGRLARTLPGLTAVMTVNQRALAQRMAEIPDELQSILSLFNGARSLLEVIDDSPFDDLSTLSVINKLHVEGLLVVIEGNHAEGGHYAEGHEIVPRSSTPPSALGSGAMGYGGMGWARAETRSFGMAEGFDPSPALQAPALPTFGASGASDTAMHATGSHGVVSVDRSSQRPTGGSVLSDLDAALTQGSVAPEERTRRRTKNWVAAVVVVALLVLMLAFVRNVAQSNARHETTDQPKEVTVSITPATSLKLVPLPSASAEPVAAPESSASEAAKERTKGSRLGPTSATSAAPVLKGRLGNDGTPPTAVFPE